MKRISRGLLTSEYVLLSRVHDLLLKVGPRICYDASMGMIARRASCMGRCKCEAMDVDATYIQKATPVRGIQRLAVLDLCPYVKTMSKPHSWQHDTTQLSGHTHAGTTGDVLPIAVGMDQYLLYWGVGTDDKYSSDRDIDGYTETAVSAGYRLLRAYFKRKLLTLHRKEDAPIMGGVLQKMDGGYSRRCNDTIRIVYGGTTTQLSRTFRVIYVYDICTCETQFENLKFVNDAARSPLAKKTTEDEFKATYGIEQKIRFKHRKSHSVHPRDWWSELYSEGDTS